MKGLEPTSERIVHVIYDLVTVCHIGDISCLRLPDGFSLFSKQCGLGVWVNGIGLRSRCGTLVLFVCSWAFVTSSKGSVWFSVADFSKDAIGDLDRVREYRCLGSDVHIVSHSGSSKPRIRFA